MMNDIMRRSSGRANVRVNQIGLRSGMAGAVGTLVMILALAAGTAVALVFAATLAVIMALATLLLALSILAWRMRPRPAAQRALIQTRRAGHAWIAYGSDEPNS